MSFDGIWCSSPQFLFHSCVTQTVYVSVHLSQAAICCCLKCFALFASLRHVREYCCMSEMCVNVAHVRDFTWNREMVPWST